MRYLISAEDFAFFWYFNNKSIFVSNNAYYLWVRSDLTDIKKMKTLNLKQARTVLKSILDSKHYNGMDIKFFIKEIT